MQNTTNEPETMFPLRSHVQMRNQIESIDYAISVLKVERKKLMDELGL